MWTDGLKPLGDRPVPVPVSGTPKLTQASAVIGPDAVAWASQVGETATDAIIAEIPYFGATDHLRRLVQAACEAAILTALTIVATSNSEPVTLTDEARAAITYYIHNDVPLELILRAIRISHAEMSSGFLGACEALMTGDDHDTSFRVVSAQLFSYMNEYSRECAEFYEQVHAQWHEDATSVTRRIVKALLGDDGTSTRRRTSPAERTQVPYDFEQWHRAVIVTAQDDRATNLQQIAYDVLRLAGSTSHLIVPVTPTTVWAWGGGGPERPIGSSLAGREHAGVLVALGGRSHGVNGFRESHQQASDTAHVQALGGNVVRTAVFEDIEMVVLLARDLPAARRFVRRVLGPLASDEQRSIDMRRTVKAYLDLHGSPSAVAERLHLARNTVSTRIQRASELLGRELGLDCADVHVALVLFDTIGPAVSAED